MHIQPCAKVPAHLPRPGSGCLRASPGNAGRFVPRSAQVCPNPGRICPNGGRSRSISAKSSQLCPFLGEHKAGQDLPRVAFRHIRPTLALIDRSWPKFGPEVDQCWATRGGGTITVAERRVSNLVQLLCLCCRIRHVIIDMLCSSSWRPSMADGIKLPDRCRSVARDACQPLRAPKLFQSCPTVAPGAEIRPQSSVFWPIWASGWVLGVCSHAEG